LDCVHPAQAVMDALSSDRQEFYAEQLENWFQGYAQWRGIPGIFKPLAETVARLTAARKSKSQLTVKLNDAKYQFVLGHSIIPSPLPADILSQVVDQMCQDETKKLPLTALKLLALIN